MEERIQALEEQSMAYGLVLGSLIAAAWSTKDDRNHVRDVCCDSLEANYADKLTPGAHERIQRMLHEVEALFQLAEGASKAIPQQ